MSSCQALQWLPLLLCLCLGVTKCSSDDKAVNCAAADSLVRLSEFVSRVSADINADGYFGFSLVPQVMNTAADIGDCGAARLAEFEQALARINDVLAEFRSAHAVHSDDTGYNSVTYRRICRPLEVLLGRRLRPAAFRWHHGELGSSLDAALMPARVEQLYEYDEETGDACLRDVLATRRKMCFIAPKCRRYFLSSRPSFGYLLTHQMIYLLSLVEKSCHERLSDGRPVDESLLLDACRRMYREHRILLNATWSTDTKWLDLALEQAVLCGSVLGTRDFFTDATTLLVRRRQSERLGCLKMDEASGPGKISNPLAKILKVSTGRKLMRDVELEGSCSAHTSGLAAAYFALYLRT